MGQILQTIESEVRSKPSAMEYEMAYQARIAIDRIRFAIKQTEQFGRHSDQGREASLQLLDALDRLETADRQFSESIPRRLRPKDVRKWTDWRNECRSCAG